LPGGAGCVAERSYRPSRSLIEVVRAGLDDHPDADTLARLTFAAITGLEVLQLMQPGSATPSLALEKMIVMFGRELREGS
jgi:hypothetical protein